MSDPTTDSTERSELLRQLRESPVPALVADFPRGDLGGIPIAKCRVTALKAAAVDAIRARVAERMVEAGQTPATLTYQVWAVLYGDACARELIAEAVTGCRPIEGSADAFPRLFITGEELAENLTPAEVQRLLELYNLAQLAALADQDDATDAEAAPEPQQEEHGTTH